MNHGLTLGGDIGQGADASGMGLWVATERFACDSFTGSLQMIMHGVNHENLMNA